MISRNCRIVLCGQSVFLTAIEAGLSALLEVEITHFNPHLPEADKRIMALKPAMVVMDRDSINGNLALGLLNGGLPVVALDAADNGGMLLTARKMTLAGAEDMIRLVSEVVGGEVS